MRLLQVAADGANGGGTTHVLQLLRCLSAKHEVAVATESNSYLLQQAKQLGIKTYDYDFMKSRFSGKAVSALSRAEEDFRPDITHCHGGRAAFFASFSRSQVRRIYTVHGYHFERKPFLPRIFGKWAEQRNAARSDVVLFVSKYDQSLAARQRLVASTKRQHVIYNGIPDPQVASEPNGNSDGPIGFVGRLVEQKHPELFLETLKRVPDVRAEIVGDGELKAALLEKIEAEGLSDRVHLHGGLPHREALSTMARFSTLVMPSRWEGLPILLLEAMALRVPIVATRVGGIPELIEHEKTGFLANESAQELAEFVSRVRNNPAERLAIVEAAKERVSSVFSEKAMVSSILEVYESL